MLDITCCGVIVFYGSETVLVASHKNHYSFPKGKKEKGEEDIETAFRELKEETGILRDQITLYQKNGNYVTLDEYKAENRIRYYIGELI